MKFRSRSNAARTAWLVAVLPAPALPARAAASAKPVPPNVLLFATDDRNDWVGPLNSGIRAKTPNLGRLAARGVTFQTAQACGTFCAPSRTALFTGRHPATTGACTTQVHHHDRPELRQSAPSKFAAPGPETKDLRLVTEGVRFRWKAKGAGAPKKNKSARRHLSA